MDLSNNDREKIVFWASKHPEIKAVYLFGSRPRGDSGPDSDIDLGLVLNQQKGDSNTLASWIEFDNNWKVELARELTAPLDLQWYDVQLEQHNDGDTQIVWTGIKKDGVLLYHE